MKMRTMALLGALTMGLAGACDGAASDGEPGGSSTGGGGTAYEPGTGDDYSAGAMDASAGGGEWGAEGDYAMGGGGGGGGAAAGPSFDEGGLPLPPETPQTGGSFEPVGTNPFVMADHDPLSTFAVDVDTASYDIFRQYMGWGQLPPADSVRLEEFVNYFSYADEAPTYDDPVPFSISLEAAPGLVSPETTLVRVGIQGREQSPFEKKPASLVFLIDSSGSMSASNKLPLVKVILSEAVEVLEPTDTVAIVSYAGSTKVALTPTPASSGETIVAALDGLSAGGSTWGEGGINLAYQQAEAGFIEGGINHVILCTDGDFNVGTSGDADLVSLIEEKRKTGITLTVLGFGMDNLNDSMMEKLSNAGNGTYAVIANQDQAVSYAHDRLLSSIEHIAQDVKIQVVWNPAKVLAYRLLGYENRAIADVDFTNDKVDAGEIGAGHHVTALYEVIPVGGSVPEVEGAPEVEAGAAFDGAMDALEDELCRVKVRYKQPGATEEDPAAEVAMGLVADAVLGSLDDASADLRWAAGVAAFAEVLKQSPYAAPAKLDTIREALAGAQGLDVDRNELVSLFDQARGVLGM